MANLPIEIHDAEAIVTMIKKYHLDRKNQLTYHAFIPPYGQPVISVIRQIVGDDVCKDTARELFGVDYRGLAVIVCKQLRTLHLAVYPIDGMYYGHAHDDFHFLRPPKEMQPGVPLQSVEKSRMINKCKDILALADYYYDPTPDLPGWSGPRLA